MLTTRAPLRWPPNESERERSWFFSQSVDLLLQIISEPVAVGSYKSGAGTLTVGVVLSIFERDSFMLTCRSFPSYFSQFRHG